MSKSNKIELDKRILIVSKLLLSGKVNKVIFRYASLNWNITNRQTQNYIKASFTLWYKEFKVKHKANLSYHLAKRGDLYSRAYKEKDWKTCLEIAKDESKILDLYPSEKTDLRIEEKNDQDVNEKKALEKFFGMMDFLNREELSCLMAIIEGKKEYERSGWVKDPKGEDGWRYFDEKKKATLKDLVYVVDRRKKLTEGGEKD